MIGLFCSGGKNELIDIYAFSIRDLVYEYSIFILYFSYISQKELVEVISCWAPEVSNSYSGWEFQYNLIYENFQIHNFMLFILSS